MRRQKIDEELLLEEFERMLSEGGSQPDDEEDFGYYSVPSYPGLGADYGYDYSSKEPPEIPREAKCKHQRKEKRYLITSHYFICLDCKKDLGDI